MRLKDRRADAPLRVLHLPRNIGGHAAGLARAEREIGLDSRAVVLDQERFGFAADEVLCAPGQSALAREAARWRLLSRAVREADIVHYNWGEALFAPPPPHFWSLHRGPFRSRAAMSIAAATHFAIPFRDLGRLRRAGKVIAVTFQGDDARQGDVLRARYERSLANVVAADHYSPATDRWKRRAIAAFDRHADLIFALNPDLLDVLPARACFLPYASVDPRTLRPTPTTTSRPIVVHAPTDRHVKGTTQILAAVDELRARGVEFEFDLVQDVPHEEAMRRYARADLLVDQLHAGFYGGLAVELMALGKPVACYLRDTDLSRIDAGMRRDMPVMQITSAALTDQLEAILRGGGDSLAAHGARTRAFMEKWHDPRKIAARLKADYTAAIPPPC